MGVKWKMALIREIQGCQVLPAIRDIISPFCESSAMHALHGAMMSLEVTQSHSCALLRDISNMLASLLQDVCALGTLCGISAVWATGQQWGTALQQQGFSSWGSGNPRDIHFFFKKNPNVKNLYN